MEVENRLPVGIVCLELLLSSFYQIDNEICPICFVHISCPCLVTSFFDSPSKFFLVLQSYCFRFSVVLLSYDSRSTPIRPDRRKKFGRVVEEFSDLCLDICTNLIVMILLKSTLQRAYIFVLRNAVVVYYRCSCTLVNFANKKERERESLII